MTIKQTGGTVVGAVVQNLPIVIDGRQSIYEEGLKNGTLPEGMTYKQFLDMLSVGVSDEEVKKIVAATVSAELIRLGLANQGGNQAGTGNNAAVTPTPAPTQPEQPVSPALKPAANADISDETLAEVYRILGKKKNDSEIKP